MANKSRSLEDAEKIQVTFNKAQLELIRGFEGIFGASKAEIVRNITVSWLFDKRRKENSNGK